MRYLLIIAALALGGCQRAQPEGNNVVSLKNAVEQLSHGCPPLQLATEDGRTLASALIDGTKVNFAAAYAVSCKTGELEGRTLIDAKAVDQARIFLVNAPEANVASIYLSEVDGNKMVLEYPFLTTDGKSQVPSADELEEAIYCAVVGATPEEQESSGRCLVD